MSQVTDLIYLDNNDIAAPIRFCTSPGCRFTLPVVLYCPQRRIAVAAAECMAKLDANRLVIGMNAATKRVDKQTVNFRSLIPSSTSSSVLLVKEFTGLRHGQSDLQLG